MFDYSRFRSFLALLFLLCNSANAALFFPPNVAQLVAAINLANINGTNDIIDLGGNTFSCTTPIGLNGLPTILNSGSLIIQNGIIDRNSILNFRLLEVAPGANLSLANLTLQNGSLGLSLSGGAVMVDAGATLDSVDNVIFLNNTATIDGGAIAVALGGVVNSITNSTFTGNQAVLNGGAQGLRMKNLLDI